MLDLVLPAWYAEAHDRAWQEYQVAAAQHAKQQAQLREKMSEATDSGPAPTMSSAMTLASFCTGPALPTDPVPTFLARGTDRAMLLPVIHYRRHEPEPRDRSDHLQQARSKYELVIADKVNSPGSIDVIVEMVGTLWFGHRDRHEGGLTSAAISPASAEAALSIATTLVHLFSIGAVCRKPS